MPSCCGAAAITVPCEASSDGGLGGGVVAAGLAPKSTMDRTWKARPFALPRTVTDSSD